MPPTIFSSNVLPKNSACSIVRCCPQTPPLSLELPQILCRVLCEPQFGNSTVSTAKCDASLRLPFPKEDSCGRLLGARVLGLSGICLSGCSAIIWTWYVGSCVNLKSLYYSSSVGHQQPTSHSPHYRWGSSLEDSYKLLLSKKTWQLSSLVPQNSLLPCTRLICLQLNMFP